MPSPSFDPTKPIKYPHPVEPGEHFFVSGKTGTGKSSLLERILDHRRNLIVCRTKLDKVKYRVDATAKTWAAAEKAMRNPNVHRIEVHPPRAEQATVFFKVIMLAGEQSDQRHGGWTLDIDEGYRMCTELHLTDEVNDAFTEWRSKRATVILGTQRPVFIGRYPMSESRHAISFAAEGRDLLTLRDSFGRAHADAVATLDRKKYEFVWSKDGEPWVGTLADLQR